MSANTDQTHPQPQLVSKVGILGAGISGISAAKQLSPYNPVIFEATDSIGGVWKHCSYRCTTLQTPRCDYEFSDYPWPKSRDNSSSFPSYQEVLDYLHGYAKHFDVLKHIKFNSKVVEIRYVGNRSENMINLQPGEYGSLLNGNPVWEVAVQMSAGGTVLVEVINYGFWIYNVFTFHICMHFSNYYNFLLLYMVYIYIHSCFLIQIYN